MKRLLAILLVFSLLAPAFSKAEAAMYDPEGNRIFGRQNNMRHGNYDPRIPQRQFDGARDGKGLEIKIPRSMKKKKKYIICNLSQDKRYNYRLNILKLRQGAPRICREDVKYIIDIPYKTKSRKRLKPYTLRK